MAALPHAVVCSVVCLAAELVTQNNHLTALGSVNQGFFLLTKVQCVQGCRQDHKEKWAARGVEVQGEKDTTLSILRCQEGTSPSHGTAPFNRQLYPEDHSSIQGGTRSQRCHLIAGASQFWERSLFLKLRQVPEQDREAVVLSPVPTSALFAFCSFVFKDSKFLFPSQAAGRQQHLHHLR